MDMSAMMEAMMGISDDEEKTNDGKIHSQAMINDILETMSETMDSNNLEAFRAYLQSDESQFQDHAKAIEYDYPLTLNVYNENGEGGLVQVSPNQLMDELGFGTMNEMSESFMGAQASSQNEVWNRLPDDETLRNEEYRLVEGEWPDEWNEVVLAVDENMEITDFALYSLGLMDQQEVIDNFQALQDGGEVSEVEAREYTPQELLDMEFKLVLNSDLYQKSGGLWIDMSEDEDFVAEAAAQGETIRVVGIIQPNEGTSSGRELGRYLLYFGHAEAGDRTGGAVTDRTGSKSGSGHQRVHGTQFGSDESLDMSSLTAEQRMQFAAMSEQELAQFMSDYSENMNATYESNLEKMGAVDLERPSTISIYANSFEDKEAISALIDDYNEAQQDAGNEADVITYNDVVGTMMESVTSIIDMISYVLMAFVSVSLIVSSIMIGIITYISVLERTKEIGILRAIGASKKDISHVFNAEAFIIGLISGLIGIGVTLLLNIPISAIVEHLAGVAGIAQLPAAGGVILVIISLLLTTIAGLIPSRIASRKDPVEALRTE